MELFLGEHGRGVRLIVTVGMNSPPSQPYFSHTILRAVFGSGLIKIFIIGGAKCMRGRSCQFTRGAYAVTISMQEVAASKDLSNCTGQEMAARYRGCEGKGMYCSAIYGTSVWAWS